MAATRLSHSQPTISRDGSRPQALSTSSGAIAVLSAGEGFSYAAIHPLRAHKNDTGVEVAGLRFQRARQIPERVGIVGERVERAAGFIAILADIDQHAPSDHLVR